VTSDYQALDPATPAFRPDGTLFSERYEDVYASSAGALEQARHVFLGGNGLPDRWRGAGGFTIVETGFGAGLNFLAAWQAWKAGRQSGDRLDFVSVEKHPFAAADLARIHAAFPDLAPFSRMLVARYPVLLPGFHRLHLADGVTLTLLLGEAATMLGQLEARADAFFLDGFAPARNPDMWSDAVFRELGRLAAPGATCATYTVASAVRAGLEAAGFAVEKQPGFGGKRDMLAGRLAGVRESGPAPASQRALVIGAGLAGAACAHRLAARGWAVEVLERHGAPAQEASGNPAGLVRPVLSLDWNLHSRFTTGAFLYAVRHVGDLRQAAEVAVGEGGVLQVARDAGRFDKQQRLVEQFRLPEELLRTVDAQEAASLAGAPVSGAGWWFPQAAWIAPASLCQASLQVTGTVHCRFGVGIAALGQRAGEWEVLDAAGGVLARAPVVVLANGHDAARLAPGLPLRQVRGQMSFLPVREGRDLRIAVCREGYVTPAIAGFHYAGASFNEGMAETAERVEDHQGNLDRVERMLPGFAARIDAASLKGRVAFRAAPPDRLPLCGPLAQPGLYACTGLGSRGMTWGALAAELVASRIAGDPLPLERSLVAALAPDRFGKTAPQD
jgi:tRNA 5-methylaminomethyl-2-thiouridine biosynthesis bifunctional protein